MTTPAHRKLARLLIRRRIEILIRISAIDDKIRKILRNATRRRQAEIEQTYFGSMRRALKLWEESK